jgi:Asp-tRNA(Asn)/Glu-tRNA(Gln) amidotransferase A subunit family amidase
MVTSGEICPMDTTTLARRIAAKELSAVEVVDAVLDRLDRLDPARTTRSPGSARSSIPPRSPSCVARPSG